MLNGSPEIEEDKKMTHNNGQQYPIMSSLGRVTSMKNVLCVCDHRSNGLKREKFRKKIFSNSYKIREHTDKQKNKQTNRQTDNLTD